MKTCPRCAFDNKDGAKFCVKCGQILDKHCPKCDSVVEPDELYCHVCGTRLDGKRVCPACNAANEPDSAFCENCGTPLNLSGPAAVRPKPVQKKSASGKRIFDIVRASVALAFSLIMFISCFFSVGKISPSATFDVFDIEEVGHIKITSVDVIEGAFSLLDPMSDREFFSDFTSFALEHLSSKEQELLENGSPAQQMQVMIKLLEDYNILKVFSLEEVTKYSASVKAELWIAAVLSLGYILLCTAFLILSVIDFVFVLSGKKRIRATLKLNVVLLAILLSLNFFLKMVFSPNWKDMAPGISMVLIFGILFIGLEIAGRIVSGELRFSKKQLASYISAGVGAVIALVVLSLAAGSIVTVRCSVSSLTESFKGGYSASALSKGWDALLQANENPDIFGQAETTILTAFELYHVSSPMLWSSLTPAMMGVLGNMEIENFSAIIGVMIELVTIALIVVSALAFMDSFKAIADGRKTKLVYPILILALALVLLATSIVYSTFINEAMVEFTAFSYKVRPSVPFILCVSFAVIQLIQRIVCGAIAGKKERENA